jgi:hypothetical protein
VVALGATFSRGTLAAVVGSAKHNLLHVPSSASRSLALPPAVNPLFAAPSIDKRQNAAIGAVFPTFHLSIVHSIGG